MIQTANPQNLWRKTTARLKSYLIQEIPEELSPCEFDCHRDYCTYSQANTCTKRLILLKSQHLDAN